MTQAWGPQDLGGLNGRLIDFAKLHYGIKWLGLSDY